MGCPWGIVADASIINRNSRSYIICGSCRAFGQKVCCLNWNVIVRGEKFNNMAVLLNATKKGSSVYDSGYGYGYGYGAEHVSWKHKKSKSSL